MTHESQSTSIVARIEDVADHLRSIIGLAAEIRGRNAKAIAAEASQALADLGYTMEPKPVPVRVAVGAGVARGSGLMQP